MKRIRLNLTGFRGVQDNVYPVLWLNFEDIEDACAFWHLQMATQAEIEKLDTAAELSGFVGDLMFMLPRIWRVGGVQRAKRLLSQSVVFTAPIAEIMARYDMDDVVFTGDFSSEEEALRALVSAANIQKAACDFHVDMSDGVLEFLHALVKSGDCADWLCGVCGSRLRVVNRMGAVDGMDGLASAVLSVVPRRKVASPVMKVDFRPFKSLRAFLDTLEREIGVLVNSGAFGMAKYYIGNGEMETMAPRFWYLSEVGNDWVIVTVELGDADSRGVSYRVGYEVDASGSIVMRDPLERVYSEVVWVREGETGVADSSESPKTRSHYSVPTKKFQVVKADVRSANEATQEKRYILGVVLEPNDGRDGPLNPDTQGDVYSASDIEKAAHAWMSDFLNVGLMHVELVGRRVVPVESYIAPMDMQLGDQKILKGSWLLGAIVDDQEIWDAIKAGTLTGWSMGGFAVREPL